MWSFLSFCIPKYLPIPMHPVIDTFSLSLPDAYVTSHSVACQLDDSFTYFSSCFVRIGLPT